MGRVQRDDPEHAHVLVEHHDLGWRLHDLNREQAHERNSWHTQREGTAQLDRRSSLLVGLEHARAAHGWYGAGALMTCCDAGLAGADGSLPYLPPPVRNWPPPTFPAGRCRPARHPSDRACRRPCVALVDAVCRGWRFAAAELPQARHTPSRRSPTQQRPPHGTLPRERSALARTGGRSVEQLFTARERDFAGMCGIAAVPGPPAGHRHRVAHLHRDVLLPARAISRSPYSPSLQ